MKRLLPALLLLAGCDSYHYQAGRFLEGTHKDLKALKQYEAFLRDAPKDPRAAELHVRAGAIYRRLQQCLEARRHYEAAARDFPTAEPWERLAKAGIMDCPDYFPLDAGLKWVLGDSASGGKAARIELVLHDAKDDGNASISSRLFAGDKEIRSEDLSYEKRDWGVWETRAGERSLILRYPFRKGESWTTTRGGEELEYRIESDAATVKTAAGKFTGCLKVREYNKKYPETWKYDYFAPFVGRVLTSVAGSDFENPNTELIKFRP